MLTTRITGPQVFSLVSIQVFGKYMVLSFDLKIYLLRLVQFKSRKGKDELLSCFDWAKDFLIYVAYAFMIYVLKFYLLKSWSQLLYMIYNCSKI